MKFVLASHMRNLIRLQCMRLFKGRTIRNHGRGGDNFSVDEYFFSPICLHEFFFRRGNSARFFFSTELLLILKAYKAPHSLITVPLKVTLLGVSIFAKFEYRDYRERNEILNVSHLMTRDDFFSLVKETLLRRVGRYHSLITVELKSEKREKFEGNIVRIFSVVCSVEDKNILSNRQMDRATKSSQSIRQFSQQQPSHSHLIPERNATAHSQRKLSPIQWKELPPNPRYYPGHKNGRCFCIFQHFYGRH